MPISAFVILNTVEEPVSPLRSSAQFPCPSGYPKAQRHIYYGSMPEALLDPAETPVQNSAAEPRLLVELPSRRRIFQENLRDVFVPRPEPHLELRSAPAPFWADVFVERGLPWSAFVESCSGHTVAFAVILAAAHFFALHPGPVPRPAFDRAQVMQYEPPAYLPPLDTRRRETAHPAKSDPEYSRQPIISVPREADNHFQTIVTPPNVKLKSNVALPNMVAWSDKIEKPRLFVPPAPLTPAAEITRLAPKIDNAVVTPPPDAAHLTTHRNSPSLQTSVVAPPPSVSDASARPLGDLNIGSSAVIAPAPQLAVSAQRSALLGRARGAVGAAAQVVPPPPSVSAVGSAGSSMGARGRAVALNLHPSVGAPPDPPSGNRRGAFAATPEGHSGATGAPGSTSATANSSGSESNGKKSSNLPAGLYVGGAPAKTPATVGEATNAAGRSTHLAQPSSANLSASEREVFGGRKFYSLTLNMPNLNSVGGSWVIRFTPLQQDPKSATEPLSEPTATRKVDPAYPAQLMTENVGGTVMLYAVIHADGTVGNVRVLRSIDDRLDRYASQALVQWRFQPATKNGTPVDVEATFQIPFHPQRAKSDF